jgi:hypothetical protein
MTRTVTVCCRHSRSVVALIGGAASVFVALASATTARAQCSSSWATHIGDPELTYTGRAYAFATLAIGELIVGGSFTSAGGVTASNVARVNLTTNAWSALPNGVGGTVNALAVIPTGATDAGDVDVFFQQWLAGGC